MFQLIDLSAFGRQLQAVRIARSMTQEQLAECSGLSAHYIGNLEQGVRTPSSIALMRLCHALGTTPDHLLKDSISDEMLSGLSVNLSKTTTLRDALVVFDDLLSDYFGFDDEPTEAPAIPSPSSNPVYAEGTLSDLLLRMSEDEPESI